MRLRMRIATAVLATGLIAACGGGGSSGSSTSNGGSGGTPSVGGHLVMGVEAENDGFDPTANRWATTGQMYGFSVYDPLAAFGADDKVHPFLAKSIDPSPDYKTWTIALRPNIKFSNGDPLTVQDVVTDLTAIKAAPLTGHIFDNIASITVTGPLSLEVSCKAPWVAFPAYLTTQEGAVFDPVMLRDPNRSMHPIGTGPFTLREWVPGNHFLAVKNPNYWQKGLPYLDSIEFRPILDEQQRENSLQSGTIQIFHTSDPEATHDLKGHHGVSISNEASAIGQQSQNFIMLNTAKAPLNDPILRRALAYATDSKQIIDIIDYGLTPPSDGPFSNPGSVYHAATGYPTFDLARGKQLVRQYEEQHGVTSVSFELGTTNASRTLQEAELVQQMWKKAGVTTTIKQVEQSQYILNALEGQYQAYLWRQFGSPDPDAEYIFWSGSTALPVGQLALNFSRNNDPQIQADLEKGRTSTKQADRVAAYEDIAKRFAVDLPFLWTRQTLWQTVFNGRVHGITGGPLPDGTTGVTHTISGIFRISHVWLS